MNFSYARTLFLFVFVFVFLAFVPFSAHSADEPTGSGCDSTSNGRYESPYEMCSSGSKAYNAARSLALSKNSPDYPGYVICQGPEDAHGYKRYSCRYRSGIDFWVLRYFPANCPSGTVWFESEKDCLQPCSDRNPATGSEGLYGRWTPYSENRQSCRSGCIWRPESDLERKTSQVCGSSGQCGDSLVLTRNVWMYSGAQCPTENPPPPPPEEPEKEPGCTPASSGQTFCMMPNGDSCHSVPGGRTVCWKSGEQGQKTDGPNTQEKKNGNQTPNPPEGSSTVSSTTVTTTTNNNSSNTTYNNYTTNNGGPAGSTNAGQSADSNGKPTGGTSSPGGNENGEDDGKENGSTGGGDCETPPVGSGDAALAQIATQTWQTRCVIESRNKELDSDAESLAGASDGLEGVSVSDIYDESSLDFSQISESLLGGSSGTCSFGVSLQLMGKPIELPPEFWELASFIRMLIIALAYIWVAQQLSSD